METTLASVTDSIIDRLKKAQSDLEDLREQLNHPDPDSELKFEGIKSRFNTFLEEVALMFDQLNELKDKLEENGEKGDERWGDFHVELEKSYENMKKAFRV